MKTILERESESLAMMKKNTKVYFENLSLEGLLLTLVLYLIKICLFKDGSKVERESCFLSSPTKNFQFQKAIILRNYDENM
jgi:hypothetical protein